LTDGSKRPIALRANALVGRAPIGLLPGRIVAYDKEGRVIGFMVLPRLRSIPGH
jgi:hypothetical protein